MRSILDTGPRKPFVLPEDRTSKYVLIGISVILLVFWYTFLIYTAQDDIVGRNTVVYGTCPTGHCPTNVETGEKRCLADMSTVALYDLKTETCNPRYSCSDTRTPFALLTDGSTNVNGFCDENVACRCIPEQRCPIYTMALFSMTGGSEYVSNSADSKVGYSLVQVGSVMQDGVGSESISLKNPNTEFCAIGVSSLNRIAPNACDFVGVPSFKTTSDCIATNPCITGTIAYVTKDSKVIENIEKEYINNVIACVPGEKCSAGNYPLWDAKKGKIECVAYPVTAVP